MDAGISNAGLSFGIALAPQPLAEADMRHVLARTEPLWADLRGERVFVTGGTGFFGLWMAESFLHANRALGLRAQLTLLSRAPERFARRAPHVAADPAVSLLAGDVRSFAFPPGQFAHVLHAATDAVVPVASLPEDQYTAIVEGTARVLEFAQRAGSVRFLLTSSGAVYGPQPRTLPRIGEEHPFAPVDLGNKDVYTRGKRAAESLCLAHGGSGLCCTIARGFAFYGPHLPLRAHFAAGNFLADALDGKAIAIGGDGTPLRSYLYAADLAVWLWTILLRGAPARAYNVGSEQAVSIRELAERTVANVQPGLPVQIARPAADQLPSRYVPSTERARSELGLESLIGLDEAMRRTASWYRGLDA